MNLTPAERIRTAIALYWTARRIKAAALRQRHPEWSEERVEAEVRRLFLLAGDR